MTYYFFSFVLGSVLGSGLKCLCDRNLEGRDWMKGRSCCDVCGHTLQVWDLLPIVSYLFQRGRCRYCGNRIDRKYIIVECMMGAVFVLLFYVHRDDLVLLIRDAGLCCLLLYISLVDIAIYEIPEGSIILGIGWVFVFDFLQKRIHVWNIVFAFLMCLFLCVMTLLMEKITRKECFGGGDIKMLFMVDLYLGYPLGVMGLMTACMMAGIMMLMKDRQMLAFAPYISIGTILMIIFNKHILWYWAMIQV